MGFKLVWIILYTSHRDYFRGYIFVMCVSVHIIYRMLTLRTYGPSLFSETIKMCHLVIIEWKMICSLMLLSTCKTDSCDTDSWETLIVSYTNKLHFSAIVFFKCFSGLKNYLCGLYYSKWILYKTYWNRSLIFLDS